MSSGNPLDSLLSEIKAKQQASPVEPSNYDKFLGTILHCEHPRYCELVWDGTVFQIVLTKHFQKAPDRADLAGPPPGGEVIRQGAWRYFKQFDTAERAMMSFRVVIKDWLPVNAVVTVRPEAAGVLRLSTARLRQLAG